MGATNIGPCNILSKLSSVSSDEGYFFVDGKKVYDAFNPPHLLKATRNNLLTYNYHFLKNLGLGENSRLLVKKPDL